MPSAILVSPGFFSRRKVYSGLDLIAVTVYVNQHKRFHDDDIERDGQILLVFLQVLRCAHDFVNLMDFGTLLVVQPLLPELRRD